MSRYAENTTVSTDRSRSEIEKTVSRYGATNFLYGWDEDNAVVQFKCEDRLVRFVLPLPDKKDFRLTPKRRYLRSEQDQLKAWEQACRQRWRALALAIKAKLEAVETGITSFEREFMAHIVLPDGQTVADYMIPQIEQAYLTCEMPKLLPMLTAGNPQQGANP